MRIFSDLIHKFLIPFFIYLGTLNLYASSPVDLIETFGLDDYLLQQKTNTDSFSSMKTSYLGNTPAQTSGLTMTKRTIQTDIAGLYISAGVDKSILIQTIIPELTPSSKIANVKDHEFTPSAFGKEQKIYNLIQAIHNVTGTNTKPADIATCFEAYFNNYPKDIKYIKTKNKTSSPQDWMGFAAKNKLDIASNLGTLDSLATTDTSGNYETYLGFFNDFLSRLRAIGIKNLTKPATLSKDDPISILYAVTQIGSRGLNSALVTKIAANPAEITEEDAYSILKSSECLFDSIVGSEESTDANAAGTLMEQWNFITSPDKHTIASVTDTLSADPTVSVSSTLQNVIKVINENYSTLKNADLITLYNKLIPITNPIQDAISIESIQEKYNKDGLSLQEYIYYLLTEVDQNNSAAIEATKERIITCCDDIVTLLDKSCCKECYDSLDSLNQALYKTGQIFHVIQSKFDSLKEIDLTNVSFNFDTEIAEIQACGAQEATDPSNPCKSPGIIASLDAIQSKISQANATLESLFPDHTYDPYTSPLPNKPKKNEVCETIRKITCDASSTENSIITIPSSLNQMQSSIQQLTQSISNIADFSKVEKSLPALKTLIEKIQTEFRTNKTALENFSKQDDQYIPIDICQTDYLSEDGLTSQAPCHDITPQPIITASIHLDESFTSLLQTIQRLEHNHIHQQILQSLEMIRSCNYFLFSSPHFEKIAYSEEFSTLLSKISASCAQYPDLSPYDFIYTDALSSSFKNFLASLKDTENYLKDLLLKHEMITPHTLSPFSPAFPASIEGTEALWNQINRTMNDLIDSIRIHDIHIPIDSIGTQLQDINQNLQQIQWEKPIDPTLSVQLDSALSTQLTDKITALQQIFKDPGCCKIAAQNAQKLLKVLTLLNAEDISVESLTHSTSCDLYQRIETIMQNFSDTPQFLTALTDELTLYYQNFYQKDCDFADVLSEGSCQTLLQTCQKINESFTTTTERIVSMAQTFNASLYDPDLLSALDSVRVFYQKMTAFFDEIWIPAMTVSPLVISTLDHLTDVPQCKTYCQLCNAALWSDEKSVLNIGENLSTILSKVPANMAQIAPSLSLVESKIRERRCDPYADLLYSNYQRLQFISEAIRSIHVDAIDAEQIHLLNAFIKQNASNNPASASPEAALSDELAFLIRLLEQISGNSFIDTPSDSTTILGHERIPTLTFLINDCLQEIIHQVDAVIPNHINHFNSELQEALSILLRRLTGIPSLFSQLTPNNSACEICDSFVFDHLQLNMDPILNALELLKERINNPTCHHKLSVSLKSLCDKISAFAVNHNLEDPQKNFTNLLNILQSNTMCKADEMAEALEPLIQAFDHSFDLNAEVIQIETNHPDFDWIDSMNQSVQQIFHEIQIISDQIKKIALSIQHGDEIPAWILSFRTLHTALKDIYQNPSFLPACTHPIHQSLIQMVQNNHPEVLWNTIDANITEVQKNAHAHAYLPIITALDRSVITLYNHMQELKKNNGYQWFSEHYPSLLPVIDAALKSPAQQDIFSFLEQTTGIINQLNQSLNKIFSTNPPPPSLISDEYGHPTASLQLSEIMQHFAILCTDFNAIASQAEWEEKHTANPKLSLFFMNASELIDNQLKNYQQFTNPSFDCEYCGALDFSDMIQKQQDSLNDLKTDCLKLKEAVSTCFACKEMTPDLFILSNQLETLYLITNQIKSAKNPLHPASVIEVMNCIEPPLFSPQESIDCTTAQIFINELHTRIKALNEALNRVYLNSSLNLESSNSSLPPSSGCSAIPEYTKQIKNHATAIAETVQTITYDAMAPPTDDWQPLINQNAKSLSMVVEQFLTQIIQTLKQAKSENCVGCDHVQLQADFNNLMQAHEQTIKDIIALENAWNSYEFDKVVFPHLQNIYYFKTLTHELVQWFTTHELNNEFCKIIHAWNQLIQEIGPNLSSLNLKESNYFQTLSHSINYSIEDFSSSNNSLEKLNHQLIQLPDIANQNFKIVDAIKAQLMAKHYFNPRLDYLFQQTAETWNHFIRNDYFPSFQVGPHTFTISEDFAVFLSQLSQKWHDLSMLMKQQNTCCVEKAKKLQPLVSTLITLEAEFDALSQITNIQKLDPIDLNPSLEALQALNQLMQVSSQQRKPCNETAVLDELNQKLDAFRTTLSTIRKLLTQDPSDFTLASLDVIPASGSSCESVEISDQLIYYSLKNIKSCFQRMYEQSVQNQSTIWGQQNTDALPQLADTFQLISENLAGLFNSWFCGYCPLYYRNSCYQMNTENLVSIAQIHTDLYDNVKRRCCNERAQDSVVLTEYFYNFAHHFSLALANSTLLNQSEETLTKQLAQTCHLLTPHLPSILEWITQDPHQLLDSENCKQILHQLEAIWSPKTHETLPINRGLLGCEQINLCWVHIQTSMNEILNSITALHQKITTQTITPSAFEREALQKIATFFYQTFESFKNYTPGCAACSPNDLSEAALACLHISKEIESLCAEESTCCKQRLTGIKSAAESIDQIKQSLEIIATASKTKRLSDTALKSVFESSPLAEADADAITKLETLAKLVTEFARQYHNDFSPVTIRSDSSNTCETIEYYVNSYKNSLADIKDLLNQMATYYITQDHISINSETADFINNLSSYISFLSSAPILDICSDCQNNLIESCYFEKTDAMDLSEDVVLIIESLSNKCCLFESRLIHQIGLSVETITEIFKQLTPQTFVNCLNNPASSSKWRKLIRSIQATITNVSDKEASFAAHSVSASSAEEELAASNPPFLNRFVDQCEMIATNLTNCFDHPVLAPSHFLPNLKYNCSQKMADFQYMAEFLSSLSSSFEQLARAIIQNNLVYQYNPEIISAFESLKKLISRVHDKISSLNHSACPTCSALMQLRAPYEIFAPSFSLLPKSIDMLLETISKPNCCNENTENLLIFLGQLETIDYSFEKLSNVWLQDQYQSLIGSDPLNEHLENILTFLTNIKDDFAQLANKNFEQMINSIITSQRFENIRDTINHIYTAYTNDSIVETIDGMQMYASIPPCERLNFTIHSLTHLFKKLTSYFDRIQTFWNFKLPEYLPAFASQLSRLFTQLSYLKEIFYQSISNGFGHFSHCKNCIQPTDQEIQNFNVSFSQASLASITDFYASFRCAKESLKRLNLLKSLQKIHQAVYHCVNFPVETVQTSVSIATYQKINTSTEPTEPSAEPTEAPTEPSTAPTELPSEQMEAATKETDSPVNITNTNLLDDFMTNWGLEIQTLTALLQDNRDLFEEDDAQSSKIDDISQRLGSTAQQIETDYNNLTPERLMSTMQPIDPFSVVHSCYTNIQQQKQIATMISEILLGYIKGTQWYLNQPYSFNINVYKAASKFQKFLTHCYSMQLPESDCSYCQNHLASTQHEILSSIHQCMLENEQFLEKIKHPKCSLVFIRAFNAFNLALNDCVQQVAAMLPLPNKGDQYYLYQSQLNDINNKAKKIPPELDQFKNKLSSFFLTLRIAHAPDVLCLSAIPSITEQLNNLTTYLNTSLHNPIHELSVLLRPGTAKITSNANTNAEIIEANSLSNQEKINYIYLQILASLNHLNDSFSQLADDFKISSAYEPFSYSSETINVFEAFQQCFSNIKLAILEFSQSEVSSCLSTEKFQKNPFFPNMTDRFDQLDATNLSIISILKDRLWNTLLPGINNFITQNYAINQKISILAENMGDFQVLDSKICYEILPSLENINKALINQFSSWNQIVTEDKPNHEINEWIEEIEQYNSILNSFNTQSLTDSIQAIANTLNAMKPGNNLSDQPSSANLYAEQVKEKMESITTHLMDQDDNLKKLIDIQIDESGNASMLLYLKNIQESIALLSPKVGNFFQYIQATLHKISADYDNCLSVQADQIKAQLNNISSTVGELSCLFETGNCCKGLSNAYNVLITETRALSNRIQNNTDSFKIIDFFNEETGATLDLLNMQLTELFDTFYSDNSKDIANCKASQIKFYLIPKPNGNGRNITQTISQLYAKDEPAVASSSQTPLSSPYCSSLFNMRNQFIEEMQFLENAFYSLINPIQLNGLQADDNINFLGVIINKIVTLHDIIEKIYLNRKNHTCNTCEFNSDKDFFYALSQSIHRIYAYINSLKDTVSNFCCQQATETMLTRCYSFTRNVSQQLQALHQDPIDLIQMNTTIKTFLPICASLYDVLQAYFKTALHSSEKDDLINQMTAILASLDASETPYFTIKPFNRTVIPVYFTKITEQLESLPLVFTSLTSGIQAISHASYPELCANLKTLSHNIENLAQLFKSSSHANSLLHDENIAFKTHQEISTALYFLNDSIHALNDAVWNNSKEKMIQKTVSHIHASLQETLNAIHLLKQYIHHELDFGAPTETVIEKLQLLTAHFPTLSTIAQAWVRIANETPVQSFDELNAALTAEQTTLEQTTAYILSLASTYHQKDAQVLTIYEADPSDITSLNVALTHIQQTIEAMTEELAQIAQIIQSSTSRKFHADIIEILSTSLIEKINQWENAYITLAGALRNSGNTTYNVYEYADILQNIAQTIHHIPFKITHSIDALLNLKTSKKTEFLTQIAIRIHALMEGSHRIHSSNTHLDQAKTFFNQFVPLSKQLVASYIQLQHTPAYSVQEENQSIEYLSLLDQLIQMTQSTFNISIHIQPKLATLRFDRAFLKEIACQIKDSLDILFQNYQAIQNQWLIQEPYAIQPALIRDCSIILQTFKTMASPWHLTPFIDALHLFISKLHQPTCCQASSSILHKIEHNFHQIVHVLHQLTRTPIPVLDAEYPGLMTHLNALTAYIGEAQDEHTICYNLANISHLNEQDASYLENLSKIEEKISAMKSRFNAIAQIFNIKTVESPLEATLANYCLQKESSLAKIASHFSTLQNVFRTLTRAFAPQIGLVRPYRPELITFFKDTLTSALNQFIQTFATLQQSYQAVMPCQTCSKVQIQKYLLACQNECASSIPAILRAVRLLETFKYAKINQFVHEIMIAQSYIENELHTLSQNPLAINSDRDKEMKTIHTTLSTLQSSWSAFIKKAKSTDTSVFADPVQTLLESIHQNYTIIQSNLIMNAEPQGDQSAALYYPEIAYTTANMEADCERIHQLSIRIQNHLAMLYAQALKARPYNLTAADLFHNAYLLNRYLYEHQDVLTPIKDSISRPIIQNFIPSAESLQLFRRFSFLLNHEQCCEPYIERIQTIGSNFSELIHSIEELISITPFISIQTDAKATQVAQYLKATSSQPSSILQLLNHLRPSIQELIHHISVNFNPFCFAAPDETNHLDLLNGIQQQITYIHAILEKINVIFKTTSNTPISLSDLPDQIFHTNIYYDEQIASNWQEINTALKSYEDDIQTVVTLSETKENWCILNDSRAPILETLQALKQIFELRYYSEKALEAYHSRCCSLASDKLNEISYYAHALSTIENISLTNENIHNATTRFQFISKNLIDMSRYIQQIIGKSFHDRQTIFLLDQIKQSIINISNQLNTRLNNTPPFVSQIETCDHLVRHLETFKDCLFGQTSLHTALSQWGAEVKAACAGNASRCYAPLFIETIQEMITTLMQLSQSFTALNTQSDSFCEKCDSSAQETFKTMASGFNSTKEVFEVIDQDLNQPTCCYAHEQDLIFLFSELNDLEQLVSYCYKNFNVLIHALNDTNLPAITQTIVAAVQNFALVEDDSYINPNHHCCAEFFTPHFHQFLHDQLAPFLTEMKNVLKTVSGMNPNPTIYQVTDPDNCKNVFELSAGILNTFQRLTYDMQKLHTYFESPDIHFYNLDFIQALKELLKLSWQIKPHIIPHEYFCSGCHRNFNSSLTNLHTTQNLQNATLTEIDGLLDNFESMLNIMEKRWCKAQASAWSRFVDTAEFVGNLVQNLLNHPFNDWEKETARSIQQPLIHLTHAYQQITSALSTPLNWHQATLFVNVLTAITHYLKDASTPLTELFNAFTIPYEPLKITPTNYDFNSIVSNMERLCQNLDQTTLTLSQNCHSLAPDHIAILPTWRILQQAFSQLISKIEPSCDCHFCNQIPVSMLRNALKSIDIQQRKWIQNLEEINCCAPLQQECIEMDQIVRRLAQIFFVSKKDAIHNLTPEEATQIEDRIDTIIQCLLDLEKYLAQNPIIKQQNDAYICAASHTSIQPVIQGLNALQKAFINTVKVYSPEINTKITNTAINPLGSTDNEEIFNALVNDLQYLHTQIYETFEFINLAPVRDMHPSTLEKFNQLKNTFNAFYTNSTPAILDMINPCVRYDNCETRQIIAKIPPVLNHLQEDLKQEATDLTKMCCSRLSYQIYQFADHIDVIKQAFEQIRNQEPDVIKEFLANSETQSIAEQINQEIDPVALNNISNEWKIVIHAGESKANDDCVARSLEAFLDRWNNLLALVTSAPLNHLESATITSQINHPALYRCQEISPALSSGLNALTQLNTILGEIHDQIENTPFSYYDIFSVYKTFYFFDKLLEQGKAMLNTLLEPNQLAFCNHCGDSIQTLPLSNIQTTFKDTQTRINHLMNIFHKACDNDIAQIVQERNFLLESFTKNEIIGTLQQNNYTEIFWNNFSNLDLNSMASNCQDIATQLDIYKAIQSNNTMCLLPLAYDAEKKITADLINIFDAIMTQMPEKYKKPTPISFPQQSYAESRLNTLTQLEKFQQALADLFHIITEKELEKKVTQKIATVNQISAIAIKLQDVVIKEQEIYALWKADTPCLRWERCVICDQCDLCLPTCACKNDESDIRLVLWQKSKKIQMIADHIINFSAQLIDDCCCNAFEILFGVPSELISIQRIINIWLRETNGNEPTFSHKIEVVTQFFKQLDDNIKQLVADRNEARKKQERCNMDALQESFRTLLATSQTYVADLTENLEIERLLQQNEENQALETPKHESAEWTVETEKCNALELMLTEIYETTSYINDSFKNFAQKIKTNEIINTAAVLPLNALITQLQQFNADFSQLEIPNASRSICAKCSPSKINAGISSISNAIDAIRRNVLDIKNTLFRQNCCINLSQKLQQTRFILTSVQTAIEALTTESSDAAEPAILAHESLPAPATAPLNAADANSSAQETLPEPTAASSNAAESNILAHESLPAPATAPLNAVDANSSAQEALSAPVELFNLDQSNEIALSMIPPLENVRDQLSDLINKKAQLPEATEEDPCMADQLASLMDPLNDYLLALLQNLTRNHASLPQDPTSLPASDLNLSASFDCRTLVQNINDISNAWTNINTTVQKAFQKIQDSNQRIFDQNFLSTLKKLCQLMENINGNLYAYCNSIGSKNICLKCHEAQIDEKAPTDEKSPCQSLSSAFYQLPQAASALKEILMQFITALQNQCCYNIIYNLEPILEQYAEFVLTIQTLSSTESFSTYLNQNLDQLSDLIVFWNEQLEAMNHSIYRLIETIKNNDKSVIDEPDSVPEITPEQETIYINHLQSIQQYLEAISDKMIHFAAPIFNSDDMIFNRNDMKITIKLDKSSHYYIIEIFTTMNKYTRDLSNSILKIKDSLLISNTQDSNIKLQFRLLCARIQNLKLCFGDLQSIMPTKHMQHFMESKDAKQLKQTWEGTIWKPTMYTMLYLTDSCQQLADIWVDSLCYNELLNEVKIWSQSLNQSAGCLNHLVESVDVIVSLPIANQRKDRYKLDSINHLFLQFSKLSLAVQQVNKFLLDPSCVNMLKLNAIQQVEKILSNEPQNNQQVTRTIENVFPAATVQQVHKILSSSSLTDITKAQQVNTILSNSSPISWHDVLLKEIQAKLTPAIKNLFIHTQSINTQLINDSIQPEVEDIALSDTCQNISYIVRNYGQSIANFNTSLMRFTYISSDLYQKFDVLPEISTISSFSQAQISLEKETNRILQGLPTLPSCPNMNQTSLLISSEFALQEMLKLVKNFSVIQDTLFSIQTKVLSNREAELSRRQLQTISDTGELLPIIDLMFQPEYDERGFPKINANGEILVAPGSLYFESHQTNAKSSQLYRCIFGNKAGVAPSSERPA